MMKGKEEKLKRNTRVCNCEKALAAERIIMDLPYETVQDMCSLACKQRLFGVYKANRLILQNQSEIVEMNDELKRNEVCYSVKLNEALAEVELLKRNLYERNVEINISNERLLLAQYESTKLQSKLDKWTEGGISDVRDEHESSNGIGYNKPFDGNQDNECHASATPISIPTVFTNLGEKFKTGDIPIFEPINREKEYAQSSSTSHQSISDSQDS
ncbi:hypothetical protein QVD17_24421 [Tagetes erecta]|uniref:Uncharacterized protein n=1 Tax=Tagetes erecta TaxID=13708 RepID=A0AAD8NUR5_TARER|nr:hypothetical protein QVD17_24421 [Tagetes erecta]